MKQEEFDALRDLAARCAGYVAFIFHMEPAALFRETRGDGEEAFARHVAMYAMHLGFDMTYEQVGVGFNKHRSSVENAADWINDACEADSEFDAAISRIVERVQEGVALGQGYLRQLMAAREKAAKTTEFEGADA